MHAIITKRDVESLVDRLKEYLSTGGIIKDIVLIEGSSDFAVVLVSDGKINEDAARAFWAGYSTALKEVGLDGPTA